MNDEYNLQRFIGAQEAAYEDAVYLLRQGMMCTSYMEFIFPRLAVRSGGPTPDPYAIGSLDEANAYLSFHPLGARYRECIGILQRLYRVSPRAVFGEVDAKKLHASLTLFSEANPAEFLLETMFEIWFDGLLDEDTMKEVVLMR